MNFQVDLKSYFVSDN